MKNKTLVFLKPFSIKNPTLDEQNDFMMTEVFVEAECADLGTFYNNEMLYGKDLGKFIPHEVKKHNPEWIIAVGQSATVALGIRNQKKVLLNPKVDYEHLNNVSEFDQENTYGLFDEYHEQDYEKFQSVFSNAAWFPMDDNLNLFTIKGIVTDIING